ncbi:MAG: hypothetical protein IJ249_04425 [Paludibacteraceae bacterium]|nr:hypothetical protein [Paludibacteraceae bacterium]
MAQGEQKKEISAVYRRLIYMVIAIAASAFLMTRPVFRFEDDKGVIYVRSFSMDNKEFVVSQTEISTGARYVTATTSVKGLYYCNKAMLYCAILSLLCFFSAQWRIVLCDLTIVASGLYYLLIIYYAIEISDQHFATFYPSLMCLVPAIPLQMMVMTRISIIKSEKEEMDKESGDYLEE